MAVLFVDGFSHYANADFLLKWTTQSAGAITAGTGRFATGSYRFTTGTAAITKSLAFGDTKSVIGFAWRNSAMGTPISHDVAVGDVQIRFMDSGIYIDRAGTNIASTTGTILSANVYYHVALETVHDGSAGSVRLQVNGVDAIPLTSSLNTGSMPSAIVFRQHVSTTTTDISDVYVLDGTGGAPRNALLGDTKVETLRPTAEGTTIDWNPSSGSDNAANVADTTPDGDTTYNSSSTPNDIDTFTTSDLDTSGGTVYAVQTILSARKTDAGVRQVAPVIRQGGTDYAGTTVTLSSSYDQYRQIYPLDPVAGSWSIANVNADEFGIKMVS